MFPTTRSGALQGCAILLAWASLAQGASNVQTFALNDTKDLVLVNVRLTRSNTTDVRLCVSQKRRKRMASHSFRASPPTHLPLPMLLNARLTGAGS